MAGRKVKESSLEQEVSGLEQKVTGIEQTIKRNWKRIAVFIAIGVVIFFIVAFFTGLRIKFALTDDLVLHLEPADKSFTIANDQNQNVEFSFSVENSMLCRANCTYNLYDRSEKQLVESSDFSMKEGETLSREYTLEPYRKGSGQKIYNFEVSCTNIRSFLCPSDNVKRQKSSFIVLNYELTQSEQDVKSELAPKIEQNLAVLNSAGKNIMNSAALLENAELLIDYLNYSEILLSQNKTFNSLSKTMSNVIESWSDEDYNGVKQAYNSLMLVNSLSLLEQSEILLDRINNSIKKQNTAAEKFNGIKRTMLMIAEDSAHVYNSPLKNEIVLNYSETYDSMEKINEKFDNMQFQSLEEFEAAVDDISERYLLLKDIFEQSNKDIVDLGKNLSKTEYAKKCDLGYCEGLSGDYCNALANLSEEFYYRRYDLPADNISLDPSVYSVSGDSIFILFSEKSKDFYNSFCMNITAEPFALLVSITDIEIVPLNEFHFENIFEGMLPENLPQCCVYGECSPCCEEEECENNPELYPVILVHGHSLLRDISPDPLLDIFNKIQYQLQGDGFINAGTVQFDASTYGQKKGEWGLSNNPLSVKASYYLDYFYSLGNYVYITRSKDNIDTYAIRMNDIIKSVKYRTGKPKVNIIAHSMGGLVVRRYIQIFGEDSVDKIILIGTPNNGLEGSTKRFCRVFGEKRECEDMYSDSVFMNKLNDPNSMPKNAKFFTISGFGCSTEKKDGDGIVTLDSSKLDYAESFVVKGECDDFSKRNLHLDLLDIDKYPEVYEDIKEIIS